MKLFIIHGWTYTIAPWDTTLEILKKHGVTVKMLRVPGLTAPSDKVWTIAEYVRWADARIPNGAIALGHSNGGRILLNLLSQNPAKLKHVILLSSAGVYEEKNSKRDLARRAARAFAPLKKIQPLRRAYHKLLGASDYDRAPENMKLTLTNMLESDKNLDFSKITTPTTILWGRQDTVTPPSQAAKLKEALKNSELKFFANWTHAPYISDPSGLARAILTVLKEIK